jgi:predicted nucleic acid-binding protein
VRRRSLLYLDASALVKTIVAEPESPALRGAISTARVAASELVLTEVPRALARLRLEEGERSQVERERDRLLGGLDLVEVTQSILGSAARLPPPRLRMLDALHVASALALDEGLYAFVTYDRRQLAAAAGAGLRVSSPGAGG